MIVPVGVVIVAAALANGPDGEERRGEACSQKSGATPIGHEWLTVESAKAVAPEVKAFSGIPLHPKTEEITKASAECSTCDKYGTASHRVWSAVMGQRWVDLMGLSLTTGSQL